MTGCSWQGRHGHTVLGQEAARQRKIRSREYHPNFRGKNEFNVHRNFGLV